MLNRLKRDGRSMLGIDISSTAVKIMEISGKENNRCLESFDSELLPPNAIEGHTLKDIDSVARVIKRLVSRSHLKSRCATLAVPDSAVISKVLQVNAEFTETEVEEFILMEADKHIPYPIDEISIDFHIIGRSLKNANKLDVLMVASRSENVSSRVEAVKKAGLQVKIVDVESFAIQRAIQLMASELPLQSEKAVIVVIDLGDEFTSLYVLHQMEIIYTHQHEFGTKSPMENMGQHYGLTKAEARNAQSMLSDEITNPFIEMLHLQVKRALQFSLGPYRLADYILLAGDMAEYADLALLIEKSTKIPTVIANPVKHLRLSKQVNTSHIVRSAPSLLIACGLALRNVG